MQAGNAAAAVTMTRVPGSGLSLGSAAAER
jgi:hypothetical protein